MRWQAWLLGLRNFVVETLTWDALTGLVVRFEKCCVGSLFSIITLKDNNL